MTPKPFILDDDPTGTQAVHGVPVLTRWDVDTLCAELLDPSPACFLLTNSRALPEAEAKRLGRETGAAIAAASARTGRPATVVSRSDSTLRGHFPAEVDALSEGLGLPGALVLLCPFFADGGRVTLDGVHHLLREGVPVPVGETEFARDRTFGYKSSNLAEWVVEKSRGRIRISEVGRIDLATARRGAEAVAQRLAELAPVCRVVTVDASLRSDIDAVAAGVARYESSGGILIARTAADYAAARAGIAPMPPRDPKSLALADAPMLVVAGSYVERTTRQLERLATLPALEWVEIEVERLLGPNADDEEERCRSAVIAAQRAGRDTVLATTRDLHHAGDLAFGAIVAERVARVVRAAVAAHRPRCLVAKGGITSSVLLVDALAVRRAWVEGPALPGVPLWTLGPESAAPGLPVVVFPGNVGNDDALADLVARYRRSATIEG
ncbi:MAG: four-carbon acid sugar kinase family protein [Armatimonadota bacterium]